MRSRAPPSRTARPARRGQGARSALARGGVGGPGSDAYQGVQMRWDTTSAELNSALQNLAQTVSEAGQTMAQTEAGVAGMFVIVRTSTEVGGSATDDSRPPRASRRESSNERYSMSADYDRLFHSPDAAQPAEEEQTVDRDLETLGTAAGPMPTGGPGRQRSDAGPMPVAPPTQTPDRAGAAAAADRGHHPDAAHAIHRAAACIRTTA